MASELTAAVLARRFHETYERLAPSFGYETRPDTKAFDPTSPNGRLMIAVCGEVCSALIAAAERAEVQDRIIAGEGADSDSAMACLMYSAMAGKDGWNSIAPQHVERMLARIEKFKKRADAAEKRVGELEEALKEIGRCDLGPSSADHLIGFRAAALARTALGKEPRT